jgi:uroporphyrinogen-III synthase
MPESPDVILLRSADDPDPYRAAFRQVDLRAVCEPVLSFAFPNQAALRKRLRRREQYAGVVATSPRVAVALDRAFSAEAKLAEAWRGAPAYAVGPKTAARLRDVDLQPRGEEAGTAEALAQRIVDDAPAAPLLFLCGNRRRDTLPTRLTEAGVVLEEQTVYETQTRNALDLPSPTGETWLVFFSPSGLEAVQQATSVDPRNYRVAAIGPTTAGALEDAGLVVDAVAAEPGPDELVAAITAAREQGEALD